MKIRLFLAITFILFSITSSIENFGMKEDMKDDMEDDMEDDENNNFELLSDDIRNENPKNNIRNENLKKIFVIKI